MHALGFLFFCRGLNACLGISAGGGGVVQALVNLIDEHVLVIGSCVEIWS